YLQR
ncbi:unnamed protein product, partial [Rotaria sp. Silwood2]